jgi:hypothetical protein
VAILIFQVSKLSFVAGSTRVQKSAIPKSIGKNIASFFFNSKLTIRSTCRRGMHALACRDSQQFGNAFRKLAAV